MQCRAILVYLAERSQVQSIWIPAIWIRGQRKSDWCWRRGDSQMGTVLLHNCLEEALRRNQRERTATSHRRRSCCIRYFSAAQVGGLARPLQTIVAH